MRPAILYCLRAIRQFALCALQIFSLSQVCESQTAVDHRDLNIKAAGAPVLRRFEERYRSAARLQATFLERYTESGRLIRTEAGKVYFLRPGKMRWEYESPEKNLFLVDGKNAWFYVPADHTVTRVPAKESTDWRTPLALLAGRVKLSKICKKLEFTSQEAPESSADVVLYCELRGAPAETTEATNSSGQSASGKVDNVVFLEVAETSGDLVRVLIRDPGGVGMEFRFASWQFDPQLNDSLFRFQVPAGVAIVSGEPGSGENPVNR